MSSERARLALRVLLTALGAVAVAVGILDVLVGPRSLIDGAEVPASVDSEYRFAHALWIGYGIAALWVARRAEHERTLVRGLALVLSSAVLHEESPGSTPDSRIRSSSGSSAWSC
jgi:hypothetical protein